MFYHGITFVNLLEVIIHRSLLKGGKMSENKSHELATFAGGCFWCMQPPFENIDGVISTTVGYSGGDEENPSYEQVAYGLTGHSEAVQIVYDPQVVTYEELLEIFWMNIDPTQEDGQFADRGRHYTTAVFYHNDVQKEAAYKSRDQLEKSGRFEDPIVTRIEPYKNFYRAEEYHQRYFEKNPVHYNAYKKGSGREDFIKRNKKR